jgi:hypothetical protein
MYACFITFFFSLSWGLLSAPNLAQGMNFTGLGVDEPNRPLSVKNALSTLGNSDFCPL